MHAPEPLRLFKPAVPQPARPALHVPSQGSHNKRSLLQLSPSLCLPIHLVLPHVARCDVLCPPTPPPHQELRVAKYLSFFFLMYIIFKVVIEFITILFLLYVLVFFGPEAGGILAPQLGIESAPLHWQAESQPLDHQGSPQTIFSGVILS